MNGRYKKVDLYHKWIVRTSLGLKFSTPAPTGKKVYFSLKCLPAVTQHAKRAARSMTGLTLLSLRTKTENDITRKVEGIDSP